MNEQEVLPKVPKADSATLGKHLAVALSLKPGDPIPDATRIYYKRNYEAVPDHDLTGNNVALMFKQCMSALLSGNSFEMNFSQQNLSFKGQAGQQREPNAAVAEFNAVGEAIKFMSSMQAANLKAITEMHTSSVKALADNTTKTIEENSKVVKESFAIESMTKAMDILEKNAMRLQGVIDRMSIENETLRLQLKEAEEKEIEDLANIRKLSIELDELQGQLDKAMVEGAKSLENEEDKESFLGLRAGFLDTIQGLAEKLPGIKQAVTAFMSSEDGEKVVVDQ